MPVVYEKQLQKKADGIQECRGLCGPFSSLKIHLPIGIPDPED